MRLPPVSANFNQYVRYGRYVTRRLRRAKMAALAASCEKATAQVKKMGRAWEDAAEPIQDALADRDGADDDLDNAAKAARSKLAGRSADAAKEAPYKLIFADGVGYYTEAPINEQSSRYKELKMRLAKHLPAKDEVRIDTTAAITTGISAHAKASDDLSTTRTDEALAATQLQVAIASWVKQQEKIYGALVAEFGKGPAERFFPTPTTSTKKKSEPDGETSPTDGSGTTEGGLEDKKAAK